MVNLSDFQTWLVSISFEAAILIPAEPEPPVSTSASETPGMPEMPGKQNLYRGTYTSRTTTTLGSVLSSGTAALSSMIDSTGTIRAKDPFRLTVDAKVGELKYTFGENSKTLEKIEAVKGVMFAGKATTISCENLNYDVPGSKIVATGPGLEVRLPNGPGVAVVTAQKLNYNVAQGEMDFSDNVQVLVHRPDGGVTQTTSNNDIENYTQW